MLNRNNWIKFYHATDADGEVCPARSKEAVNFCLLGYLENRFQGEQFLEVRSRVARLLYTTITAWNDQPERTWEDVEFVLKRANLLGNPEPPKPIPQETRVLALV